jgi:2-hydroxychromene-2-carboxylate isomerase
MRNRLDAVGRGTFINVPDRLALPMKTAFSELRGDLPLSVYIDLKSPYAYLAIQPTRDMAAEVGVEIDWRPFTLDILSFLGSAKLDKKGVAQGKRTETQWMGVRYTYMDARRYANLSGLTVRGTVKIWDSSLAGIAMLWAKRQGGDAFDRFIDHVYPPFWRRELDIEDGAVLETALRESGAAIDGFCEWAAGPGRAEHDRSNEAAFEAGVFGVPTYLVEDELWFGREHLPRVQWLLGGRKGESGDVENRSFAR